MGTRPPRWSNLSPLSLCLFSLFFKFFVFILAWCVGCLSISCHTTCPSLQVVFSFFRIMPMKFKSKNIGKEIYSMLSTRAILFNIFFPFLIGAEHNGPTKLESTRIRRNRSVWSGSQFHKFGIGYGRSNFLFQGKTGSLELDQLLFFCKKEFLKSKSKLLTKNIYTHI